MDSRPSNSSVTKSPVLFSTSASASFHSHLSVSSSSSQRRLRALSRPDSDELPQHDKLKSPAVLRGIPSTPQASDLPLYSSEKSTISKTRSSLHWLFLVYCVVSVILFTACLSGFPQRLFAQKRHREISSVSPINDFPLSYRFSRLLQAHPRPLSFSPFTWNAHSISLDPTAAVTACLWMNLEDIKHLEAWSLNWDGPLSIVVVTSTTTNQEQNLVKQVQRLPAVKEKATVHMIQGMPDQTDSGNSYLNLARLFARTRFVVLFPAIPLSPFPAGFYHKISTHTALSNSSQLAPPLVLSPSRFKPKSPIPFGPLSPLLVEQSYPIWCSERFFTAPSREDDWEECIWQFWLNSYGHLSTLPHTGWRSSSNKSESVVGEPLAVQEVIHRRLSNRFRHESCVLAAKRLKDRSGIPGKVNPRKAQWLRKTCRQVMSNWEKELL